MLIDTHCHLDASVFTAELTKLVATAKQKGVQYIVIPAVNHANFNTVRQLAHGAKNLVYALGIHPLYVPEATESDLDQLALQLAQSINDPQLVAVGEIGLDFFVPALCTTEMREKQIYFYQKQLQLAQQFDLPVLLHVRRSQDLILKYMRLHPGLKGIAHAFNGSDQQAQAFIQLGLALGFGGAMTFTRAKQIRRLATELDLSHLVLETDAPDMAPAWLNPKTNPTEFNRPTELPAIAQVLADLRQADPAQIAAETTQNAFRVLPRLAQWHQQQIA